MSRSKKTNTSDSSVGFLFFLAVLGFIIVLVVSYIFLILLDVIIKYRYFIVSLIIIIIIADYIKYKRHNIPISYEQARQIAKSKMPKNIKKRYIFSKSSITVDSAFKSALKPDGQWYKVNISVNMFPAYVASLLKGKKHEWVVVGIEKNGVINEIWVNKGTDNKSVNVLCGVEPIFEKCDFYHADSIIRLHNHPNSNPLKYTTLVASKQDKISGKEWSGFANQKGYNWFDFVCAQGSFICFHKMISDKVEYDDCNMADVLGENDITPKLNYKLYREWEKVTRPVLYYYKYFLLAGAITIILLNYDGMTQNEQSGSNSNIVTTEQLSDNKLNSNVENSTNEEITVNTFTQEGFVFEENEDGSLCVKGLDDKNEEIDSIIIPAEINSKKVTMIGDEAFENKENIKTVIISANVESIGEEAFRYCKNITEVNIPDSVKKIGRGAFSGCSSLKNVTLSKNLEELEYEAFWGCPIEQIELPDSLIIIGEWAFCSTDLTRIKIPEGVEEIGKEAFKYTKLETVELPETLKTINKGAFSHCNSLISIKIPKNVKKIPGSTFSGCYELKTLYLPEDCEIEGWFLIDDSTEVIRY